MSADGKETEEYYGLAETYNVDKEDRLGVKVVDDVVEPAKFSNDESDMYYQIKSEYENDKYICSKKIDDKYFYTSNIKSGRTIFNADGTVKGIVYSDNEVTTNFYKYMNSDQLKDLVNTLTSTKDKLEYTPVDEYIENIKNN